MVAERLIHVSDRIKRFNDTIFGPPPGCKENGPKPTRTGQMGAITDAFDRVRELLNIIEEDLNVVEKVA